MFVSYKIKSFVQIHETLFFFRPLNARSCQTEEEMKCVILFIINLLSVSKTWDWKQVFQKSVTDTCKKVVTG